ncbi:hypothetical protein A5653_18345 [Mycobacterium colombiense]|uniref:hypothetical protein n=1 Tax=Mycobacterium colombiense TaxID=339268 RepID=UPI0007EF020A|nr:hypothetical protein [Mycobacterium colombiense]OBK66796.1 hypothetical protein A5653_18345 [Mycobacterium colombiense]
MQEYETDCALIDPSAALSGRGVTLLPCPASTPAMPSWASTVLELLGEDCLDDLEMMAPESLARAALAFCADPQDADVIASMEEAGRSLLEISQLSS